jgi:tRNA uridine 5-carboxymethylaminomethyl modification enzyme
MNAMKVFQKDENLRLPLDLDYDSIHGLSMHEKSLLRATRPESVGQARRIEGITPSGCLRLLSYVQIKSRAAAKAVAFAEIAARKEQYLRKGLGA